MSRWFEMLPGMVNLKEICNSEMERYILEWNDLEFKFNEARNFSLAMNILDEMKATYLDRNYKKKFPFSRLNNYGKKNGEIFEARDMLEKYRNFRLSDEDID